MGIHNAKRFTFILPILGGGVRGGAHVVVKCLFWVVCDKLVVG